MIVVMFLGCILLLFWWIALVLSSKSLSCGCIFLPFIILLSLFSGAWGILIVFFIGIISWLNNGKTS